MEVKSKQISFVEPTYRLLEEPFSFLISVRLSVSLCVCLSVCVCSCVCRDEQPGGAGAGGARLQDALSPGLPHLPPRAHGAVLEEGRRGEAHVRVPAGLPGGLLHGHGAAVPARGQPLNAGLWAGDWTEP